MSDMDKKKRVMTRTGTIDRSSALPASRFPLPLATERLQLRPFAMDDAGDLFAIHGDEIACRYMAGTLTREASLDNLRALISRVNETGYGPFAVELPPAGEVIGWAGVQQLPGYPMLEVLFALKRERWGLGYASECCQALLKTTFRQLGVKEVVATVDPRNVASIGVLRKQGFVYDGPFAHKLKNAQGHLYRVTRDQYEQAVRPAGMR
jgi:RimJ/RimL family protein N-acetyltransferase